MMEILTDKQMPDVPGSFNVGSERDVQVAIKHNKQHVAEIKGLLKLAEDYIKKRENERNWTKTKRPYEDDLGKLNTFHDKLIERGMWLADLQELSEELKKSRLGFQLYVTVGNCDVVVVESRQFGSHRSRAAALSGP
jgi:hypothetical protein